MQREKKQRIGISMSAALMILSVVLCVVFIILFLQQPKGDTKNVFQAGIIICVSAFLLAFSYMISVIYKKRAAENKRTREGIFSTRNITRMAIMTALSYVLYMLAKFNLPFFPFFLDMQISDVPAILCGFMMGPVQGCLVIFFKVLLKLPFSSTVMVGELADFLIGIAFVLPSSLYYRYNRTKKGALIGLLIGLILSTVMAVFLNWGILVPWYVQLYYKGDITGLINACKGLYPSMNESNFYFWYLLCAVLPFNILRGGVSAIVTFLLYKSLGKMFNKMVPRRQNYLHPKENSSIIDTGMRKFVSHSENETIKFARKLASQAKGGEVFLLSGDLGAGKTVFAKGVALALGITSPIKSPTFTLCCEYQGSQLHLWHFDAYRLVSGREGEAAGLNEHFGDSRGVCVIEWPEQIESILPPKAIRISIKTIDERTKEITVYDE